jgi:ArsR family transcriptional regulator, arsenate/arsenite/antimonite-responsive transcriptional repressor
MERYAAVPTSSKTLVRIDGDQCCVPLLRSPLAESDAVELARMFAALSDPVRLRLLSVVADGGEVCSCDLEAPLGKSQPTVSHHTKALAAAGLIAGQKRGKWTWWRVVPERLDDLRHVLDTPALTPAPMREC